MLQTPRCLTLLIKPTSQIIYLKYTLVIKNLKRKIKINKNSRKCIIDLLKELKGKGNRHWKVGYGSSFNFKLKEEPQSSTLK